MIAAPDKLHETSLPGIERYVSAGDSCPELRVRYDVDIREFVVLACVNDAEFANQRQVAEILDLSLTTVDSCLNKLADNGLVLHTESEPRYFRLTTDGLSLLRKATR